MGLDYMIIGAACERWMHAELRHLPHSPIEPVVWIDEDRRLRMYHPAVALDRLDVKRTEWDAASFGRVVKQLIGPASQVIADELASSRMPPSFYSEYPSVVRDHSDPNFVEMPADIIEVN